MPPWLSCVLLLVCMACAPTHHVLRSRWVAAPLTVAEPSARLGATAKRPKRVAVVGCEAGCDAAVRSLEDALFGAGFELVDARVLAEDAARHQRTTLETASLVGLDHVLFVAIQPSAARVTGHFERSYFSSPGGGLVGTRVTPSAKEADRFDLLLARAESRVHTGGDDPQTLSVALVRVTGEQTLRFRSELSAAPRKVSDLTVFVRCQNGSCAEEHPSPEPEREPRRESRRVETSGPRQASFRDVAQALVDRLLALPEAQ